MKKKVVALLLIATMAMSGCAKQAQGEDNSVVSEVDQDTTTQDDTMTLNERAQKLTDYYASISVWVGANVQGVTQEAMADMGGMKVILRLAEKHGDFDYDKFFRAYASNWRAVTTAEYEKTCYMTDRHPLHFLRCNTVVQQFDKFYETYDIKEGDNMYLAPEDRVLVW